MDNSKKYYQLIPQRIYGALPVIESHIEPKIKGYKKDYLLEVISLVASRYRKKDDNSFKGAQIQISYLKKLIPQGDKYLAELISLGIVIRTGKYKVGEKSFEYEFSPDYDSKYKRVPLTDMKLVLRINKHHKANRQKMKVSIRGRSEQVRYLYMLTIQDEVFDAIEKAYPDKTDKYNYAISSATRIKNRAFSYNVDTTSNRFHSNITNMPKLLIPYLRAIGKPLYEVDIRNSHPYLSSLMLTNPSKLSEFTEDNDLAMMLQTLQVTCNEDVMRYISLVTSGQIYEYLREEINAKGLELTRGETKLHVFRILFSQVYVPTNEEKKLVNDTFNNCFPTVANVFAKIKGKKYNQFAILLARVESYLMLEVAVKKIDSEFNDVVLSKHDSVLLTTNIEAVQKILIDVFGSFVGFSPVLKTNYERLQCI